MSDGDSSKPKYVLTLVHGTFARDADWVNNPQSPLRQRLQEKLGDVDFEVFKWTGGNSDVDRYAGADGLQWAMRCVRKDHPDRRQFVIGHSHGGNVILRALDGFTEAGHIDGAVTLATPFINCKPRDLNRFVRKLRNGCVVLLTLLAIYLAIKGQDILKALGISIDDDAYLYFVGAGIILWLATVLFLCLKLFSKSGSVLLKAKKRQDMFMADHDVPGDVEVPFLSVATGFDEAAIVLGVGTRLAELILHFDTVLKWIGRLLWVLIIAAGAGACIEWNNLTWGGIWFVVAIILLLGRGGLAVLRTATSGVGAGFRGLIRSVIFGSGGITKNALVAFWTTKKPVGVIDPDFRMRSVDVPISGMRHSAVYTTSEILDEVADWIRSKAKSTDSA